LIKLNIKLATITLLQGGVIAYPTEAVWGLGCDPWNKWAVMKLLAVKQRPMEKGLILVADSTQQFGPLFEDLSAELKVTLNNAGPAPITWLIPDPKDRIPLWLKGSHSKIAIRISSHPLVRELCQSFGSMIVSTSANESGAPEIKSRLKLVKSLGDKLGFIVPGQLGSELKTSTIKDLESGMMLRE